MREFTVCQPGRYRSPLPSAKLSSLFWLPSSFFWASCFFRRKLHKKGPSRGTKTDFAKSCCRLGAAHDFIIHCTEAPRIFNHIFSKNHSSDIFHCKKQYKIHCAPASLRFAPDASQKSSAAQHRRRLREILLSPARRVRFCHKCGGSSAFFSSQGLQK